jgi:hypothetical protein
MVAEPLAKTLTERRGAGAEPVAAAAGAAESAEGTPTAAIAPASAKRRCNLSVISYPVLSADASPATSITADSDQQIVNSG